MTASQAPEPGPGAPPARKTFGSLNPATGQPVATFPVYQREDADVAVSRAREAARWWGGLGWR
jgi:acyl-CoA reductase-like NAD-dependent aldehyde dehydrogenase